MQEIIKISKEKVFSQIIKFSRWLYALLIIFANHAIQLMGPTWGIPIIGLGQMTVMQKSAPVHYPSHWLFIYLFISVEHQSSWPNNPKVFFFF